MTKGREYYFQIQELDGYTDGKPSWRVAERKRFSTKDAAQTVMEVRASRDQLRKFRIRKITRHS